MMKVKIMFYGGWLGLIYSIIGSGILAVPVIVGFGQGATWSDAVLFWMIATFYGTICSIIPGVVGGAYLGQWLLKIERTLKEAKRIGSIVGAIAGLISSLPSMTIILASDHDSIFYRDTVFYLAFTPLVMFIAGWAGSVSAQRIAKRLEMSE